MRRAVVVDVQPDATPAVRAAKRASLVKWRLAGDPVVVDRDDVVERVCHRVSEAWLTRRRFERGIALVQVGGDTQQAFFDQAAEPLLQRLRAAAP